MKKLLLAFLLLCVGIAGMSHVWDSDEKDDEEKKDVSIESRIHDYVSDYVIEEGWYSDCGLKGTKTFFDFSFFPYKKDGQYLVNFMGMGYGLTELGNITICGGGGENLTVKDDGNKISLIHKFDQFGDDLPKDAIKLLDSKETKSTAYEQAKEYFEIDENKKISQKCPKNLCNKTWYHIIDNSKENLNNGVFIYSTTPPKKMESEGKWWTLNFVDNHDMTEIDRSCSNNENDGRCPNVTKWKIINKNTISYPLSGDPSRENRIELREVTKDTLKFVHLYE